MRRFTVIPLALLLGCWDFDSLSGTYVSPLVDASSPGDIACGKTPNQLQEDCTQNVDINNNCLYGCDDPTCSDHVECFVSKGYRTYGEVAANAGACPAQTTSTAIYQTLGNSMTCNASCSCNALTPGAGCTSNLNIYPTPADCTAKTNGVKVAITDGANLCPAVLSMKDSYYSVDKLVAACTAKMPMVMLMPSWGSSKVLCDQAALAGSSKLLRFSDMQKNNVACVVFNGTDPTVCASTKIYTKAQVYYTAATGNNTCNCSCAAVGGCALTSGNNNLLNLTDKLGCVGANPTLSPINVDSTCVQALNGAATYMALAASTNIVAPTCNATGTVSGTFTASGGMTVCCM